MNHKSNQKIEFPEDESKANMEDEINKFSNNALDMISERQSEYSNNAGHNPKFSIFYNEF